MLDYLRMTRRWPAMAVSRLPREWLRFAGGLARGRSGLRARIGRADDGPRQSQAGLLVTASMTLAEAVAVAASRGCVRSATSASRPAPFSPSTAAKISTTRALAGPPATSSAKPRGVRAPGVRCVSQSPAHRGGAGARLPGHPARGGYRNRVQRDIPRLSCLPGWPARRCPRQPADRLPPPRGSMHGLRPGGRSSLNG